MKIHHNFLIQNFKIQNQNSRMHNNNNYNMQIINQLEVDLHKIINHNYVDNLKIV